MSIELDAEIVRTTAGMMAAEISEGTEADPMAVLIHLLAGIGAAVGPSPYCCWSQRRTPPRLFVLAIGPTGAGKGYAEALVRPLFEAADPDWALDGIVSGLVSGEGLLAALGGEADPADGEPVTGRSLLVIEPEFGRVLAAGRRDGSTLTHLLRDLFDRESAASLSRTRPLRVHGAHLSVIGHVTPRELRARADLQAIENGLLNRFLPEYVKPGAPRPFGSGPRADVEERATRELRAIIAAGRDRGEVPLSPDAQSYWAALYVDLHGQRPGAVGALCARAIAHVQRLALIFALADRASHVSVRHLAAALATWRHAEGAWRAVFSAVENDPLATRIANELRAAGPTGLSRSEIRRRAVGSNNVGADRITAALDLLHANGEATVRHRETSGRPAEQWIHVGTFGNEARNGANRPPFAPIPPIDPEGATG